MITGSVQPNLQAFVTLRVTGDSSKTTMVDAAVDAGFNGYFTLPPSVLQKLSATPYDTGTATLADGREISTNLYLVRVEWDGAEKIVIAEEANGTPLVGMELMLDYVAVIEAWNGGQVTLTRRAFDE